MSEYTIRKKKTFFNYGIIRLFRIPEPDTTCGYAIKIFLAYGLALVSSALLFSTLVVGTMMLSGVSIEAMATSDAPFLTTFLVAGMIGVVLVSGFVLVFSVLAVFALFLVGVDEGTQRIKRNLNNRRRNNPRREPNLLVQSIKDWKSKVCKQIWWE